MGRQIQRGNCVGNYFGVEVYKRTMDTYVSSFNCFERTTSAPSPATAKPSNSLGKALTFCALRSATISSVKNSTSSLSPEKYHLTMVK